MNRFNKWIGAWTTLLVVALALSSCAEQDLRYQSRLEDPELFNASMQALSDAIVYDIFSPPVASRIYMYPTIAAYTIMHHAYPDKYNSLEGQLNEYVDILPDTSLNIIPELAAIHAFLVVSEQLVFTKAILEQHKESLYEELKNLGLSNKEMQASKNYGNKVAMHILKWANGDFYKETRTYPKYTIKEDFRFWKPTPPSYMEGIEPHWNKIRPMVIPSADFFDPEPPLVIDMNPSTPFFDQLMEVYEKGRKVTENNQENEEAQIAAFWDCNPYVSHHKGHAMFATKKITPGGHWIGITKIASQLSNSNFDETVDAYLNVTVALFDSFISCWDTKWKTVVVRPETLIHQYIDETWYPKLQTPPFPEYTSGHSVISTSAALVLTKIYGDNFPFVDTSEEKYGLPSRSYSSFIEASEEAAISRLYGGIHYRMAIEQGVAQGRSIGDYIIHALDTRKTAELIEP